MGFSPSLPGVIAALSLGVPILGVLGPGIASAEAIPGPPLPVSASDRAGAFCPPRAGAIGNVAGFAGAAIAAIAARRRDPRT